MPVAYDSPVLWYAVMAVVGGGAVVGARAAGVTWDRARRRLRARFLYGVPWGTITVVAVVLGVYLLVQRGLWDWHRPVVVRYMAFSLFEPVGWALAGLAHSGPDHLVGNLTSAIVFAPLVEYAWSHYPRPGGDRTLPPAFHRPPVRAVLVFPAAVLGLGVVSGLVAWGPVIGFSFVVFALLGCALVHYPLVTLAALLARTGVRVVMEALVEPVSVAEATTRVVRPGWYGTAVQGHLFGLLVGIVAGLALLRYWNRRPAPGRLWIGSCVLGFSLSLWAFWWILGPEQFVLFRGLGAVTVVALATVIALAAARTDAPRLPALNRRPHEVGRAVLLAVLLVMGLVGLGVNAIGVDQTDDAGGLHVDGYEIFYAEHVPDEMFGVVDIEPLGLSTNVTTSGVVVQSEDRRLWYRAVSAIALETHGNRAFRIGDLGWSQRVDAARRGWEVTENQTVYAVWLDAGDGWQHVWDAPPVRAEPIVANHSFALAADDGQFVVDVARNQSVERVPVPSENESIPVHDVQLRTEEGVLYASHDGTRVRIATQETYE